MDLGAAKSRPPKLAKEDNKLEPTLSKYRVLGVPHGSDTKTL